MRYYLPDLTWFEVPQGMSLDAAEAWARQTYPDAFGKVQAAPKRGGFGGALGMGVEQFTGNVGSGITALFNPQAAAQQQLDMQRRVGETYEDEVGLDRVGQAYDQGGIFGAGKEIASQVPKAIAQQAPNIAASLASAKLGAMAGTAIAPGVGTLVGGALGAFAPSFIQQLGSNVGRQAQEGGVHTVDLKTALPTAAAQGALDAGSLYLGLGKKLVGKVLGKEFAAATGAEAEETLRRTALRSLAKGAAIGTGRFAGVEIPTEVAQQVMERWQAGLPLATPDALAEYGETMYQTALTAPIGTAGGVYDVSSARSDVRALDTQRAEADEQQRRADEQAFQQSPEFVTQYLEPRMAELGSVDAAMKALVKKLKDKNTSVIERGVINKQLGELKQRRTTLQSELNKHAERVQAVLEQRVIGAESDASRQAVAASEDELGDAYGNYVKQLEAQRQAEDEAWTESTFAGRNLNAGLSTEDEAALSKRQMAAHFGPMAELVEQPAKPAPQRPPSSLAGMSQEEQDYLWTTDPDRFLALKKKQDDAIAKAYPEEEAAPVDGRQAYADYLATLEPVHSEAYLRKQADRRAEELAGQLANLVHPQVEQDKPAPWYRQRAAQAASRQEETLTKLLEAANDYRTNITLRGDNTVAESTKGTLLKRMEDLRKQYVADALLEAEHVRAAEKRAPMGTDEALHALRIDAVLREIIDRSTALQTSEAVDPLGVEEKPVWERPTRKERVASKAREASLRKQLRDINYATVTEYRKPPGEQNSDMLRQLAYHQHLVMSELDAIKNKKPRVKYVEGKATDRRDVSERPFGVAPTERTDINPVTGEAEAGDSASLAVLREQIEQAKQQLFYRNAPPPKERPDARVVKPDPDQLSLTRATAPGKWDVLNQRMGESADERMNRVYGQVQTLLNDEMLPPAAANALQQVERAMRDEARAISPELLDAIDEQTTRMLDARSVSDTGGMRSMRPTFFDNKNLRDITQMLRARQEGAVGEEAGQASLFPAKETPVTFDDAATGKIATVSTALVFPTPAQFKGFLRSGIAAKLRAAYAKATAEYAEHKERIERAVKELPTAVTNLSHWKRKLQTLEAALARADSYVRNNNVHNKMTAAEKAVADLEAQRLDIVQKLTATPLLKEMWDRQMGKIDLPAPEVEDVDNPSAALVRNIADLYGEEQFAELADPKLTGVLMRDLLRYKAHYDGLHKRYADAVEQAADRADAIEGKLDTLWNLQFELRGVNAQLERAEAEVAELKNLAAQKYVEKVKLAAQRAGLSLDNAVRETEAAKAQSDRLKAVLERVRGGQDTLPTLRHERKFLDIEPVGKDVTDETVETVYTSAPGKVRRVIKDKPAPIPNAQRLSTEKRRERAAKAVEAAVTAEQQQQSGTALLVQAQQDIGRERKKKAQELAKATDPARKALLQKEIKQLDTALLQLAKDIEQGGERVSRSLLSGERERVRLEREGFKQRTYVPTGPKSAASQAAVRKAAGEEKRDKLGRSVIEDTGFEADPDNEARAQLDFLNDRDTLFRLAEQGESVGGIDLVDARAHVDNIIKQVPGTRIVYAESPDQMPAYLQTMILGRGIDATKVKGAVLPDGTVVIVGSTHSSVLDLQRTIAHELTGHIGVYKLLGSKGVEALADKVSRQPGGILRLAEDMGVVEDVRNERNTARQMAELIAHVEQDRPIRSFTERVRAFIGELVGAVREWMRNHGLGALVQSTRPSDILHLLRKARSAALTEGTAKPDMTLLRAASVEARMDRDYDAYIRGNATALDHIRGFVTGLFRGGRQAILDRNAPLQDIYERVQNTPALARFRDEALQMIFSIRQAEHVSSFAVQTMANGAPTINTSTTLRGGRTAYIVENTPGVSLKSMSDYAKDKGGEALLNRFHLYRVAKRVRAKGAEALNFDRPPAQSQLDEWLQYGQNNPDVQALDRMYTEYNQNLIKFLRATGSITPQQESQFIADGDNYVPYFRVDDTDGFVELMNDRSLRMHNMAYADTLKKLRGGNQMIMDFFTANAVNTNLIVKMALDNLAARNAGYLLKDLGLANEVRGHTIAGPNVIRAKRNGEEISFKVDLTGSPTFNDIESKQIIKGLEGVVSVTPYFFKLLGVPANILRVFVTRNPVYAARQLLRDPMAAWMTAGSDMGPLKAFYKQLPQVVAGRSVTRTVLENRGALGGMILEGAPEDIGKMLTQLAEGRNGWQTALAKLDRMHWTADIVTRTGQYESYKAQGLNELEATLATYEGMNFARHGLSPVMRVMNQLVPFVNAQLQGLDVMYRALRGKMPFNERLAVRDKLIARGSLIAASTLMYALMVRDEPWYKNASPADRYNNWLLPPLPGMTGPIKIPIPFEPGYLFKALPEAILNEVVFDEPGEKAVQAFKQFAINASPFGVPTAIKPFVEASMNQSFFTGMPIENENLSRGQRFNDNTTELAKAAAFDFDVMGLSMGMSPAMIEHFVRSYTSSVGIGVMQIASMLMPDTVAGGRPERDDYQIPVIGGLFAASTPTGTTNEWYRISKKLMQASADMEQMIKLNDREGLRQFMLTNREDIGRAHTAKAYNQQLSQVKQAIEQVRNHPMMSPAAKRTKIDALKLRQAELAERALRAVGA